MSVWLTLVSIYQSNPWILLLLPQIYEYQGCQAAQDLLKGQDGETLLTANDQSSLNVRGHLFERFFSLHHVTNVASNGEHLNRECSLFTDDCRYVIVGSAVYVPEEPPPYFFEVRVAAKLRMDLPWTHWPGLFDVTSTSKSPWTHWSGLFDVLRPTFLPLLSF